MADHGSEGEYKAEYKTVHHHHQREHKQLLIISALPPMVCDTNMGGYVYTLSMKNKNDYARYHGYEYWYTIGLANSSIYGPWNKVNLMKIIADKQEYPWLMWVDYDTLFLNMAQHIPFEEFEGKDLIIWGDEDKFYNQKDPHQGWNGGVIIMRNSEWSRMVLAQLLEYSYNWLDNYELHEEMRRDLGDKFTTALHDQQGLVHLVIKHPEYRDKILVHTWQGWVMHAWWKLVPINPSFGLNITGAHYNWDMTALVIHFAGCQFCKPNRATQNVSECAHDFMASYGRAYQMSLDIQGYKGKMDPFDWRTALGDFQL